MFCVFFSFFWVKGGFQTAARAPVLQSFCCAGGDSASPDLRALEQNSAGLTLPACGRMYEASVCSFFLVIALTFCNLQLQKRVRACLFVCCLCFSSCSLQQLVSVFCRAALKSSKTCVVSFSCVGTPSS